VTGVLEALASLASASVRWLPTLALAWLAIFFGATLRSGEVPLIERVARIGKPGLSEPLCRYARLLTALWCAYFLVAAGVAAFGGWGFAQASAGVAVASVALFVGEHRIRRMIFPEEWFPGLIQQVRDTVRIWRPQGGPQS